MKNLKNLIYKEIKLVVSPAAYLFPILTVLLLIPSYPYIVGFIYFIISLQITFQCTLGNKDEQFTAMLPVPRRDFVKARCITVVYIEALQILYAVPFALLTSFVINRGGNPIGLDANFALFGIVLFGMGVFNLVFLPKFFKTGYKFGIPLILAMIAFVAVVVACECIIGIVPAVNNVIDGLAASNIGYQIGVFFVGLAVFVGLLILSYKLSVKNYLKVEL